MHRTVGVLVLILVSFSLFVGMAPAAHADQVTIPLGDSIYGVATNSKIEAHLEYIEIGDDRKASTQTTTPLERVKWFRLFYRYENHGDDVGTGNLKLVFIDQQGNEWKPDEGVYTGETIAPHSTSSLAFVEIPIPKDSNIVTVRVIQLFEHKDFPVPSSGSVTATETPTIAPTAAPSSPATATPQASAGKSTGSCLPLLPFAILSFVGLTGLAASRFTSKK